MIITKITYKENNHLIMIIYTYLFKIWNILFMKEFEYKF